MFTPSVHNNPASWNKLIAGLPGAHVLQSWEWGMVKSHIGWEPRPFVWHNPAGKPVAAALTLQRTLSLFGVKMPLRVFYIPKGPLLDWRNKELRRQVLADLQNISRKQGAIFIKIDPDVRIGTGIPDSDDRIDDPLGLATQNELQENGWRFSDEQVQYRNTVWIDLTKSEQELLSRMKQKTRYNVRLAGRRGVTVRRGSADDLPSLYKMYAETATRDGFIIRNEAYYLDVWGTFLEAGMALPLVAEVTGEPIGGLMLFIFARRAWYLYGMSRDQFRETMPNYLLQWEAMRQAKAAGCLVYDMWGAPNEFHEKDPMWGVFRFKQGFNGVIVRHVGAWDLPLRPTLYRLYTRSLPQVLELLRRARRRRLITEL